MEIPENLETECENIKLYSNYRLITGKASKRKD